MLYRSIRARALFQEFMLSAITSLLLVRFYLYVTDYPMLGGDGLHIAHMLWGGLLMLVALILAIGFIGKRSQHAAALVGGAGFGVFIDEIGKFVTSDNDYFFRPAVGIIYAIFTTLFLLFMFLTRNQRYSVREYELNALAELEEAVVNDMDSKEKQRVVTLLRNSKSRLSKGLISLLDSIEPVREKPASRVEKLIRALDRAYIAFWQKRTRQRLVGIFFVFQSFMFLIVILVLQFNSIDELRALAGGTVTYGSWLLVGAALSAGTALLLAIKGALVLRSSRIAAFEWFRRAAYVNIFLTEFFNFSRIQFEALPGFMLNLVLILLIGYAMHIERMHQSD